MKSDDGLEESPPKKLGLHNKIKPEKPRLTKIARLPTVFANLECSSITSAIQSSPLANDEEMVKCTFSDAAATGFTKELTKTQGDE